MILTISGLHGTGKSVVGKKIALALGIKYYSTGEAFRDLAKEKNMTLEDFTKYVEKHIEIDKELDKKIIEIAKKDDIIIDSQLSGYLLKDIADFKILLKCSLEIRVKRMAERDNTTYEEKLKETILREKSELERFNMLYNIDLSADDANNKTYDLIFSTENLSVEQVVNQIISIIKTKV